MKKFTLFLTLLLSTSLMSQDCTIVDFTMETQNWASEISWNLTDEFGNVVYDNGLDYIDYSISTETACLIDGCYTLNMFDSFGDGWNGAYLTVQASPNLVQTITLPQGEYGVTAISINGGDSCWVVQNDVYGCTDPFASNYNPFATIDDGSCNYQNDTIYGCTDPQALNYMPWANVDDSSCEYAVECDEGFIAADLYVCVFSQGEDIGFEITDDQGDVIYSQMGYDDFAIEYIDLCLEPGVCYTANLSNLSGPFGWYNGYYWINAGNVQISTGSLQQGQEGISFDFSVDGTCGDVLGCTDPESINYNPIATIDDGSCVYPVGNDLCADAQALSPGTILIDNTGAYQNEGVWGECWSFGNGEGEQSSLWFSFTTPADEARIIIEAIGDGSFTLTDTQFGLFTECGGEMIACDGNSGDGLLSKFDFLCGDLEPNTEYLLIVDGYYGDAGTCYLSYAVTSECEDPVYGCTDPQALNYNPSANTDDGSCIYPTDSCEANAFLLSFIGGSWAYEVSFDVSHNGTLIYSSDGITFETGQEWLVVGCIEDGCYTVNMYDSFGDGWNGGEISVYINGVVVASGITIIDGFEGSYTFGVNDPDCDPSVDIYGCTDPEAMNYNPFATIDDGTCWYDTTNYDCMAMFELVGIDEENDVVYLANTSIATDNAEYIWDFGDGVISYEELPTHQYAEAGTYMICLTVFDALNCISTYCDTITYDPDGFTDDGDVDGFQGGNTGWWINVLDASATSIDELAEFDEFTVYPVPTLNTLYINISAAVDKDVQINITDLRGRLIESIDHDSGGAMDVIEVNTSDLESGTYIIEALSEGSRSVRRFQVMK